MATAELTGRTVLLTGATDGLGRALAADLAGKLAHIMMTFDLARGGNGDPSVVATALHPSTYLPTKIVHSPANTIAAGMRATSRLVCQPPPEQVDGRYFDVERPARAHAQAYDLDSRARLRRLSEELTETGRHQARDQRRTRR